ncbi:receptor like protein 9 [Rhynchospora pubera]|uniref:Receptor like protein 9 n=1 Tax=Rhynchospora pubera TaxID=906938 RepID=A0AAV8H5T5_9POAL|nr:receptor like protein 9 [Rhynchospora pubera]
MREAMNYNNSTSTLLALALLLLGQWTSVSGSGLRVRCKEEERRALLHIKAELLQIKPSLSFPEWEGEECCGWERVACDPITKHVTKLDLGDLMDNYFDWETQFLLNATMFLPLPQLTSLSLSRLHISGCKAGAGFESWSRLSKLKMLDLSWNNLNSSIISSFAKVSSLRALDLEGNFEMGPDVHVKDFSALNLEVVNLPDCGFSGSLPYLGDWSSLKALSLARNYGLIGTIISTGLCHLKNLEQLDLSGNNFAGNIPPCIGNLSSLQMLDLSDNQFHLKLSTSVFERLISLRYLSLSSNLLEGTLSMSSFSNHSYLQVLGLSTRALNFEVEVVNLSLQLVFLELANCILNMEPTFLYSQCKLKVLDLSNTLSKGPVPTLWLLENNTNLIELVLCKNSFTGVLQLPSVIHENISILDISDNNLSGEIPDDISTKLPNLENLNLSNNCFCGTFILRSMNNLHYLDLSSNNITDDMQNTFSISLTNELISLDLSNNKLYGSFPNIMNFKTYFELLLNNNYISGEIPLSICDARSLDVLDISNNELSGILPGCLGRTNYEILRLSANHLEGSLSNEFWSSRMSLLDLSNNKLSGSIPPYFNNSYVISIDLSQNNLYGNFPITLLSISSLQVINIQKNRFFGELPSWNGKESDLRALVMRDNMFRGHIPEQICTFRYLRILDLSQNNFSGQIPPCIIHMGLENINFSCLTPLYEAASGVAVYGVAVYEVVEELKFNNTDLPNTKYISYTHSFGRFKDNFGLELVSKGRLDLYMFKSLLKCVLDLSSNELVGHIPEGIGQMSWLTTLNLSNNYLTGSIPDSVSKLCQLESLDLSHNALTGQIPRGLTKLTSIEAFSVAYNNLSGPTLDAQAQFGTFDNRSHEGNPNLCGPPLSQSCFSNHDTKLPSFPNGAEDHRRDESIDFLILFGSFALFFVVSFWGFMAVLYFKRDWRFALFTMVDEFGDNHT